MNSRRHKTDFVWWPRLLGAAMVLFPLSLSDIDFRSGFARDLAVSANRSSPAYTAFEDLRLNFDDRSQEIPETGMRLVSGIKVDTKFLQQTPRSRLLALKGLTIRNVPSQEPQPYMVAGESVRAQTLQAAAPVSKTILDSRGHLLPIPERKQALLAQAAEEDWSIPSAGQMARQLAMEAASKSKDQRVIVSRTGTPITIGRGRATEPTPPPIEVANNDDDVQDYVPSFNRYETNPDGQRPLWLSGQIEMTGGLAFVGPETNITLKRVDSGAIIERGRVWVTEGRFEIHVKRAVGYLVAELQTRDGRVLGRGELNLTRLSSIPRKDNRIGDIRLALSPTAEGATLQTVSGHSVGRNKIAVHGARVEIDSYTEPQAVSEEGIYTEPTLNRESSFIARATAKNHWPTLVVGQAGHPQDIKMYPNSMVDALIGLQLESMERKEAYQAAVVWGQIARDGVPTAGAQVEMAGNYRVIYFNETYLPDMGLKKTSSNGLFAFLRVRPGVQALRVKAGGRLFPAQIFPTESRHVSFIEVGLRDKVVSQFKVMDVMDMHKPLDARVRMVGTEDFRSVDAGDWVEYAMAANPFMVEAEAGPDYEISRVTMTGSPHLVQIPMIRRDWLYELQNKQGVQLLSNRGMIAGFVDRQDFEIELTGYAPGEQMQIIYLDAQGQPLQTRSGIAGGGFVIFNAPPGLQTIYIHPTQSRETYSQVVVAEPQYVHVVIRN